MLLSVVSFSAERSIALQHTAHAAAAATWTTYMGNNQRSGFNGAETAFKNIAGKLKLHWKARMSGAISAQPVISNNKLYIGSWDGNEYAFDLNGHELWHHYLGRATPAHCLPVSAGVASTPTITTINGVQALLLGGGDAAFYALNAANGNVLWRQRLGTPTKSMIWDSPALYNGKIYIGLSSFGDCPLVQGGLFQLDATSGKILHVFHTVPDGCAGGGVWGSPTIDPVRGNGGTVYFTTGTISSCKSGYEKNAIALTAVNANDLSLIGSWQVPESERVWDGDFGSTPTLFQATINQQIHQMVGALNKNGYYYAFDRAHIGTAPLWERHLSTAPNNVSSSSWDGQRVYAAATITTINGKQCGGSVRALNPASGATLWEYCAPSKVLAPVMTTPGTVIIGATRHLKVLDSATGKELFDFYDPVVGASFFGSATVVNNTLYIGDSKGNLFAFGM